MECKKCSNKNKRHFERKALFPCLVHMEDGEYHSAEIDRRIERDMDFEDIQWSDDDYSCYFCGEKVEKEKE